MQRIIVGADVVVARVFTSTQAELSPEISTELHARQWREFEEWCEPVVGVASVTAVLVDGDPPEALLEAARQPRSRRARDGDGHPTGGRSHRGVGVRALRRARPRDRS